MKWTLFQAKCSQLVLLWPHIRDCCFCCSVSLQCKSTGDEQQRAFKAASPGKPPQALSYHAVGPHLSWGGGFWAAFHTAAADGGRRQLLTVLCPLIWALLCRRLSFFSLCLRPPTVKLWLPGSYQVTSFNSCVHLCLLVPFPVCPVLKTVVPIEL